MLVDTGVSALFAGLKHAVSHGPIETKLLRLDAFWTHFRSSADVRFRDRGLRVKCLCRTFLHFDRDAQGRMTSAAVLGNSGVESMNYALHKFSMARAGLGARCQCCGCLASRQHLGEPCAGSQGKHGRGAFEGAGLRFA